MDRFPLYIKDNKVNIASNVETNRFVIDLKGQNDPLTLSVDDNANANILLLNLKDGLEIHFDIKNNANVHICSVGEYDIKTMKILANVGYYSAISYYFADFIEADCKCLVNVNLLGEGSSCNWHLSSLSTKEYRKEFDVSVIHKNINTYSKLDNYGVCRDKSKLVFSGVCQIDKGAHGSKAHQNAKIMIFDDACNGIARPVLKIDENDIEASHASVVGKIDDEHLFYLTSKGLSEDSAKQLITFGYLKPILKGFDDDEIKAHIEDRIEGKM